MLHWQRCSPGRVRVLSAIDKQEDLVGRSISRLAACSRVKQRKYSRRPRPIWHAGLPESERLEFALDTRRQMLKLLAAPFQPGSGCELNRGVTRHLLTRDQLIRLPSQVWRPDVLVLAEWDCSTRNPVRRSGAAIALADVVGVVAAGEPVDVIGRLCESRAERVDEALQAFKDLLVAGIRSSQSLARRLSLLRQGC